jgi:hypothetical protein
MFSGYFAPGKTSGTAEVTKNASPFSDLPERCSVALLCWRWLLVRSLVMKDTTVRVDDSP